MNIAVVGSRNFSNLPLVKQTILSWPREGLQLVSGGAKGPDKVAERVASDERIPIKVFHADWNEHGRKAGALRNMDIVHHSDIIHAFWDERSPGTKITVKMAYEAGKPVVVHLSDGSLMDPRIIADAMP